ncbi:hypothetical protein OAP56_03535, partial [Rickettsiaceae bacterium]|nr:hypothetical protein [Rickettsiaceae bacterium]
MISREALSRYTGGMRSSDFKQDIEEFTPKKNMDISMKDKLMYSFGRGLESVGLKKLAQFC